MSSTALEDFDAHLARPRLPPRLRAYVRLLRRVLSRFHAHRELVAEMRDPRWRADIGVPLATEREELSALAMGLWPAGS